MAGSWGTVLTGLVPLGLVISLSPLTVIPAVLVLQAPRPRPSSLAFLGGWLLSLAALTALAVAASHLLGGLDRSPPRWSSWLGGGLGGG
ncbi:GAP family protein, partial [Mycobacterium avium]|uniref:GAP family protein n=1 Tax=Mycobacterium avium TaxID=1764 RepID=UPI00057854D5